MDKLTYYYLVAVTKLKIWASYFLRFITDTEEVKIFNKNTENTDSILFRYFIIRIIDYIVIFFKYIRNYLDINGDKFQIIKNYEDGNQTIILDSEKFFDNRLVTITDLIKKVKI